jgi:uncharacterized protein YjbI with pentapeptide repeats
MNVVTIERSVKIGLKLAWMNVVTIDKKFQVPVPDMYEFLLDSPSLEKFAAAIEDYGTPLKKDGESLPIVMTIPVHLYLNCTGELFQHLMLWIHFGTALPGHISHEAVKQFSKAYSLKTLEGATHISPDYAKSSQSLDLASVTFEEKELYESMVVDRSVLTSSILTNLTWKMVSIRDSTLDHNDFTGSEMICVNMSGSSLTCTKWENAALESCNMSFCKASMGAEFVDATIENTHFDHARLQHGKFHGIASKMQVKESSFQGTFFSAFLFNNVKFSSSSFRDAHIELSHPHDAHIELSHPRDAHIEKKRPQNYQSKLTV